MNNKNIPTNKDKPKKEGSKRLALGTAAMIAAGVFSTSLSDGQLPDNQHLKNSTKKNTTELVDHKDSTKDNTPQDSIDSLEYQKLITETIDAVNTLRKQNNLKAVTYSPTLQKIAQQYADYCAQNDWKEGHRDKEGNGLQERTHNNGYYGIARENIYFGSGTPAEVVGDWTKGKFHKLNMLDPNSKKAAVGIAKMKNGSYVYVLVLFN